MTVLNSERQYPIWTKPKHRTFIATPLLHSPSLVWSKSAQNHSHGPVIKKGVPVQKSGYWLVVKNCDAVDQRHNFKVLQGTADGSAGNHRGVILHRHVISCHGLFHQCLGEASEEIIMWDQLKVTFDEVMRCRPIHRRHRDQRISISIPLISAVWYMSPQIALNTKSGSTFIPECALMASTRHVTNASCAVPMSARASSALLEFELKNRSK
jgi:hypothetical protein